MPPAPVIPIPEMVLPSVTVAQHGPAVNVTATVPPAQALQLLLQGLLALHAQLVLAEAGQAPRVVVPGAEALALVGR